MSRFESLETGPLHRFSAWPVTAVPRHAAGVYTVWEHEGRLIYVGMAGRAADASTVARWESHSVRPRGLWERLNSHASGRRSGDQFNVYVADRLVLPTLARAQVTAIADAALSFDALVRDYIRDHLGFRFTVTSTGGEALEIERTIRGGALQAGPPFLNPASR
jgi:hypothetical protein